MGIILGFAATPEAGPYEPIAHSEDDRRNFLNSETVMCVLLQFFGCWLWTYVLACCVDVVAGNDPDALEARQQKLALNRFCSFFKLPSSTSKRLREYFRERKALQMARSRQQILGFMSPGLQAELAWSVNERWLKKIVLLNKPLKAILENCPQPFVHECPLKIHQYECPRREECIQNWHRMPIWGSNPGISDQRLVSQKRVRAHVGTERMLVKVALAMQPEVFTPREQPPPCRLYVIHQGVAVFRGRVLSDWDTWGDQDVMLRGAYVRRSIATATTFLHVLVIGPEALEAITAEFPAFHTVMRRFVLQHAFREYMFDVLRQDRYVKLLMQGRGQVAMPSPLSKLTRIELFAFLSHTQQDDTAKLLANELFFEFQGRHSMHCWLDVKMEERDQKAMETGVQESKCLIAILYPALRLERRTRT